ncbi:RNA recognition motif containing protein [Musa troglodytarum]|uniref:RNA recognition motif containing protein n=1 Tax=Musa troglodytarum TaxID=320322 RepID=A0A9E7FSM6_9LILI|nr:RNA recognition motif containing protein [Musa troglodytarum]URD99244.1 RNA recognition motif containing protein [Musa troglodytarum]
MEVDLGKLFIGGISWDTNEDSLRKYFSAFGEVVEAVIMKDRATGRARGFGFVVFADPAVTERVVTEKHTIDGRMVEAKKAVPRDDHQFLNKNSSSVHGSPAPGHTKKIFVGGLASTITEVDFKKYFDQFGTITDVVVMYDHNTQRPRGFGFITYDSEVAVDKVLLNAFHELNGKMVEVKRAVPKEPSPGPVMRSSIGGYNYGLNRVNSFVNAYAQGYNASSVSGYGMRLDDRLGSLAGGRNGFASLSPGFGMGMDYEPPLSSTFVGNPGFNTNLGYGRALNPYYNANSSRYSSLIPYNDANGSTSSVFSLTSRNVWENVALNHATKSAISNASMVSRSGSLGSFGTGNLSWGSSPNPSQFVGSGSSYTSGNLGYIGLGRNSFDRRISPTSLDTNLIASSSGYEGGYAKLYGGTSVYGDPTWGSSSSEFDGTGSFSYKLNTSNSDVTGNGFADYMAGYNVNNRQPARES